MELYVIYGLPGVGKLAVAKELSLLRPGCRLFHIHMLADMLEPLFGFDGRGFIELRDRIWPMVIEQAVADGLPGLIATFVFDRSLPEAMVPDVRDHVIENGGVCPVRSPRVRTGRERAPPGKSRAHPLQEDDLARHLQTHPGLGPLHDTPSPGRHTDPRHHPPDRRTHRPQLELASIMTRGR